MFYFYFYRVRFGARERLVVATVAVCLALVGTVIGLTFGLRTELPPNGGSPSEGVNSRRSIDDDPKSGRIRTDGQSLRSKPVPTRKWTSEYRTYRLAAVTTDNNICSEIGVLV